MLSNGPLLKKVDVVPFYNIEYVNSRKKDAKDFRRHVELAEKILFLRRRWHGAKQDYPETRHAAKNLIEACNFVATHLLQSPKNVELDAAHNLLKRALEVWYTVYYTVYIQSFETSSSDTVYNFETATKAVKQVTSLLVGDVHMKAVTFNNLACYFRRIKKPTRALAYLEKVTP